MDACEAELKEMKSKPDRRVGNLPRQARLDAPGSLYHVIVRGIERRRIVDDNQDRADFVKRMGWQ